MDDGGGVVKKWKRSSILGEGIVGVAVLPRDGVIVHRLEMVFQLVRSRELATAHQTGKHLALVALVIEVSVPLEAILILERPRHVLLLAGDAAVHAFLRHGSVAEQVQAPDRHLLQLFRVVAVGAAHQQRAIRYRAVLRRTG